MLSLVAQVNGTPRETAAAKDSEWVRQRQSLEDAKPCDVNEVLLTSEGVVTALST